MIRRRRLLHLTTDVEIYLLSIFVILVCLLMYIQPFPHTHNWWLWRKSILSSSKYFYCRYCIWFNTLCERPWSLCLISELCFDVVAMIGVGNEVVGVVSTVVSFLHVWPLSVDSFVPWSESREWKSNQWNQDSSGNQRMQSREKNQTWKIDKHDKEHKLKYYIQSNKKKQHFS